MKIKQTICIGLCIIILCSFNNISVIAQSNIYQNEINAANNFIINVLKQDNYDSMIELYDINETISYLYFNFIWPFN